MLHSLVATLEGLRRKVLARVLDLQALGRPDALDVRERGGRTGNASERNGEAAGRAGKSGDFAVFAVLHRSVAGVFGVDRRIGRSC